MELVGKGDVVSYKPCLVMKMDNNACSFGSDRA